MVKALIYFTLVFGATLTVAEPLSDAIELGNENNLAEQRTQKTIDELSHESQDLLQRYQALNRELDSLRVYNDQLQRLTLSQQDEMTLIQQQIEDIQLTQQEITPLMLRMIERLQTFVSDDTPFLVAERTQRVKRLRDLMDRSDVSVAEKYRRILEAYQIELDYSRTMEAYRDQVALDKEPRMVSILRVGRIGLYYQTLDERQAGYWDDRNNTWADLNAGDRLAVKKALRIASQHAPPELLELPVKAGGSDVR